jgi:EAL domain-containing protein (putative c-di-GMP-specific phosphodiesterase class I)
MFNMISELGMVPLTEGIETEEQFRSLSQMGCELFQGYLFSKPMPLESFEAEYQIKAES